MRPVGRLLQGHSSTLASPRAEVTDEECVSCGRGGPSEGKHRESGSCGDCLSTPSNQAARRSCPGTLGLYFVPVPRTENACCSALEVPLQAKMAYKLTFIAVLFCSVSNGLAQQDDSECLKANAKSCGECIQAGPNCGWCTNLDFLQEGKQTSARCDDIAMLKSKGCKESEIEHPRGSQKMLQNKPSTYRSKDTAEALKPEDITQIQPQKMELKLRSGEPQTFTLKFKRAEDYPIDLYYLMDLSFSMKDDLENMKSLGTALMSEMKKITSDFRIGFGSLVEKTVMPYISTATAKLLNPCTDDQNCTSFSFKNVLNLTGDGSLFNELVGKQHISGNLISPKGGFDAIKEVAVCGEQIGWRNVTRLLVFSTDAGFYFTDDGKLGGIALPNDSRCHLENNMYTMSHYYDYPSIAHLVQKLNENNIQTIFAITKEFQPVYKELKNLIPKSAVGTLSSNSSNVINLIIDYYNSLSSEVILENSKLPEGVTISYKSFCKNGVNGTGENGRKCANISIGDEVQFEISITAHKCPKKGQDETMKIKLLGFTEEVEVALQFICECDCQNSGIPNSADCSNGNGIFECGACRCNEGRVGGVCECSTDEVDGDDMDAFCRKGPASEICSNNGECICGQCVCKQRENPNEIYFGMFCECDNFNCDRSNDLICGGNGICDCGVCRCFHNFAGSACDCALDTTSCISTNGQICNGRGICDCGRCKCTDPKFKGATCEVCQTCPGVCAEHKECVQCKAFNKGEKKDVCEQECKHINTTIVESHDKLPQPGQADALTHCKEKDEEGVWFYFTYSVNETNDAVVHVVGKPETMQKHRDNEQAELSV